MTCEPAVYGSRAKGVAAAFVRGSCTVAGNLMMQGGPMCRDGLIGRGSCCFVGGNRGPWEHALMEACLIANVLLLMCAVCIASKLVKQYAEVRKGSKASAQNLPLLVGAEWPLQTSPQRF